MSFARSSENWSAASLERTPEGWRATRAWNIVYANSEQEALDATPEPGTDPIDRINNSHKSYGLLKCRSQRVTRRGYGVYEVYCDYETPPGGADAFPEKDKPLLQNARVTFRSGVIAMSTDRDLRGRLIANAAGDALNPPETRNVRVKYLTIERYEPFYDYQRLHFYEQAWNTKPMKSGRVEFEAGIVLCESISPGEPYEPAANLPIKMAYNMVIFQDYRLDGTGTNANRVPIPYPWATYKLNAGQRGWYYNPTTGKAERGQIYLKDGGNQVPDDVPLDMLGKPLDSAYRISPDGLKFYTPVANPNLSELSLERADTGATNVVHLRFDLLHWMDLNDLKL